ncbi:MAG: hypothetical protein U0X75_04580 [Acidobacteriota bacterium]
MDRPGADFDHAVDTIRTRLSANPVCIQMPIGAEDRFKGIIDLIEMKSITWKDENKGLEFDVEDVPADLKDAAVAAREKDGRIHCRCGRRYRQQIPGRRRDQHPGNSRRIAPWRIAIKLVPVVCGTAFKNKGVQALLDAVIDFFALAARHCRCARYG